MRPFFLLSLLLLATHISAQIQYQRKLGVNTGAGFGLGVAVSNDVLVVGRITTEENGPFNHSKGEAFVHRFQAASQTWSYPFKINAFDASKNDQFGGSVATNGVLVACGAHGQDKDAVGSNAVSDAGAVYLFKRNPANLEWKFFQKLVVSDRTESDHFGYQVSMAGNLLIASAPYQDTDGQGQNALSNTGAVYVFEPDTAGFWRETAKITPNQADRSDASGFGSAISTDGRSIMVGAPAENLITVDTIIEQVGAAYLFERDAFGHWQQVLKVVPDRARKYAGTGEGVSVSGDWAVVNTEVDTVWYDNGGHSGYHGTYRVLHRNQQGTWGHHQNLAASASWLGVVDSTFGQQVYLHDRDMVVGHRFAHVPDSLGIWKITAGRADLFRLDSLSQEWRHFITFIKPHAIQEVDNFGQSVTTDSKHLIIGCPSDNTNVQGNPAATNIGSVFAYGICAPKLVSEAGFGCFDYAYNGQVYTQDTILETFRSCDSIGTIIISIGLPHPQVEAGPAGLYFQGGPGFSYQWLDCSNGLTPITGATDSVFLPAHAGSYALQLTFEPLGCSTITPCALWTSSLGQPVGEPPVKVFPNPFFSQVTIDTPESAFSSFAIFDAQGRMIQTGSLDSGNFRMDGHQLLPGVYTLALYHERQVVYKCLVKL